MQMDRLEMLHALHANATEMRDGLAARSTQVGVDDPVLLRRSGAGSPQLVALDVSLTGAVYWFSHLERT